MYMLHPVIILFKMIFSNIIHRPLVVGTINKTTTSPFTRVNVDSQSEKTSERVLAPHSDQVSRKKNNIGYLENVGFFNVGCCFLVVIFRQGVRKNDYHEQ